MSEQIPVWAQYNMIESPFGLPVFIPIDNSRTIVSIEHNGRFAQFSHQEEHEGIVYDVYVFGENQE